MSRLLSVVIPVFNREAYVKESVDSVLSQRLPNGWDMEVIVVDDGSTDATLKILETYGDKIKLIKHDHCANPSKLRNKAIRKARGSLIAFQDSDDRWLPGKLEKQLPLFENTDIVLSYGNANIMDEHGVTIDGTVVDSSMIKSGDVFPHLAKTNFISTLTVVVRREAILKIGGFRENVKQYEDYVVWLKIAAHYKGGFLGTQESLGVYRKHLANYSDVGELAAIEKLIGLMNHVWSLELDDTQRESVSETIYNLHGSYTRTDGENSKAPQLSVIMSVYNAETWLNKSIDSILGQTYRDFEFIIINDGSTDTTLDILQAYEDPRIRIVNQTNSGLVKSLNKALGLCRGEFIARMDADDISLPTRFEKEVLWLCRDPRRGLVSTYFSMIDYTDSKALDINLVFPSSHTDLRRALYIKNPFAHGACMFRRAAVLDVGPYSPTYWPAEDYELWQRIAAGWEVGLIPEILFWYRINNPESISQKSNTKQNKQIEKIREKLWGKPFLAKNIRRIVKDYRKLPEIVANEHIADVQSEYRSEQYALCKELLLRGKTRNAAIQFIGTFMIMPVISLELVRYIPHSLLLTAKAVLRRLI